MIFSSLAEEKHILPALLVDLTSNRKSEGRLRFPKAPFIFSMAISRILSAWLLTRMIIYLPAPVFLASSNQLAAFQKNWSWTGLLRRRSQTAATISTACDDTRGSWSGRLPFLCFVLHRMGFFLPRELLRERWALTSPFHPCLRFFQRTGGVFSV